MAVTKATAREESAAARTWLNHRQTQGDGGGEGERGERKEERERRNRGWGRKVGRKRDEGDEGRKRDEGDEWREDG